MALIPNRPQTIGQVLDTSIELFKLTFRKVWWLCIPNALVGIVPLTYAVLTAPSHTATGIVAAEDRYYWMLEVAVIIVSLWGYAAITIVANAVARDESTPVGKAMLRALRIWPLQLVILVCMTLAIGLGTIFLLVPGVFFSVSLMLSFTVLVTEGVGPFAALARSNRLIWGNWWRASAIVSVSFTLLMVIGVAVGSMAGAIGVATARGATPDAMMWTFTTISGYLAALLNVVSIPFMCASLLAIYWDVRMRKEGNDLARRIDEFSPDAAPAA
jgi:hypothetical protein